MGIFKTLYLVPEVVYAVGSVGGNLLYRGRGVNLTALFHNLYLKLLCGKVGNRFALPGVNGVENLIGLRVVDFFIIHTDNVGESLARFVIVKTPRNLYTGECNLCDIFTDFNFGNDISVLVLYRGKLINAAEYRFARCGNKSLAYTEGVNLCTLTVKLLYKVLVE